LVLDEYSPSTARDGGAAAILSHMRALRRLGYEVSFVAASDLRQTGQELAADGITVCASPFYASVEEVLRRNAGCFDVVYLHRVSIAVRYLGLVRTHLPRARVIYSVADLHHVRLARQAAIQDRPELLDESRRLHQAECAAAAAADATITHSAEEAALLRQCVPAARVHVVPWAVPAGRAPVSFTRRHGVAFIGNFAHAPNLDAARFLAEDIMKLVWQQDPALTCFLVGSRMPASIRRLARPNLVATGAVTDLAEIFEQVRLTVAPLRFGAGVKAKVLASFAAGIPCVMSPVAAEGIALPPVLQADIAASAAALAARIVVLHGDAGANRRASQAGRIMVKANFEERSVADALRQAIPRHASPAPDSAARDGNSGSNGRL
jgi:glycosyltransferase involved in cell wall biosynthesis